MRPKPFIAVAHLLALLTAASASGQDGLSLFNLDGVKLAADDDATLEAKSKGNHAKVSKGEYATIRQWTGQLKSGNRDKAIAASSAIHSIVVRFRQSLHTLSKEDAIALEDAVWELIQNKDAAVRAVGIRLLGLGGGPTSLPVLQRVATTDADIANRCIAVRAIGKLNFPESTPMLREILLDDQHREIVLLHAIEALKAINTPEAVIAVQLGRNTHVGRVSGLARKALFEMEEAKKMQQAEAKKE